MASTPSEAGSSKTATSASPPMIRANANAAEATSSTKAKAATAKNFAFNAQPPHPIAAAQTIAGRRASSCDPAPRNWGFPPRDAEVASWRETDEAGTNRATLVRNLLDGQYENPVRIVAFNTAEGWRRDVTVDIADELRRRSSFCHVRAFYGAYRRPLRSEAIRGETWQNRQ